MTKQEFIAIATSAAKAASARSGLPAGVTVAQAALESAWGRSQLARDAHNYFGIKAHGDHACVTLPTEEACDGRGVVVQAKFARYSSIEECFADRDRIITEVGCYSDARRCAADPAAFIAALAKHWATDPKYAEKLTRIYRQNGLDVLDGKRGGQ